MANRLKTGKYTLSNVTRKESWSTTLRSMDLPQRIVDLATSVNRAQEEYDKLSEVALFYVIPAAVLFTGGAYVASSYQAFLGVVLMASGTLLFLWLVIRANMGWSKYGINEERRRIDELTNVWVFEMYCEHKADILYLFLEWTRRRDDVGRATELSDHVTMFYTPSVIAFLNFHQDSLMAVETTHIRDAQITTREVGRTSTASSTISGKTGASLTGAAVGGLVFGMEGAIAGAVIGSSGEREIAEHTVHSSTYATVVDLYTRLKEFPVVTVCFSEREASAKEFFGVMSAAIETPQSNNAAKRLPKPSNKV